MKQRSLIGRVALASAVAAALGGASAALSMGVTARELVAGRERDGLEAAARELAEEVLEETSEHAGDAHQKLARALDEELTEVKLPGADAVLHEEGFAIAGNPSLPAIARGRCEHTSHQGTEVRACAVPLGAATLTLVMRVDDERARNALIGRALLVGLAFSALLGGLVSYTLARWSLSPLNALRDRVRAIQPDAPDPALLGTGAPEREIEELRLAVAQLVARLGASLRAAQAFAAEAAHELRTPLTTIGGELELLAESAHEADATALARVRKEVDALTALVQRLLVLARPERLDPREAEPVDLGDVLLAITESWSSEARARLHAEVEDDVLVRGDPALLAALVSNALDNALKFSRGPITVRIAYVGERAQLDVSDTGPGVPAEERERVFDPFYRAREARALGTAGHGLGLALIAQVAFRHGGEAAFLDSTQGAHLRVRLPRA